jgi:hypothetical protein
VCVVTRRGPRARIPWSTGIASRLLPAFTSSDPSTSSAATFAGFARAIAPSFSIASSVRPSFAASTAA